MGFQSIKGDSNGGCATLCDLGTHSILTYEMRARKEPTWLHFVRVKYNNLFAAFNTVSDLQ